MRCRGRTGPGTSERRRSARRCACCRRAVGLLRRRAVPARALGLRADGCGRIVRVCPRRASLRSPSSCSAGARSRGADSAHRPPARRQAMTRHLGDAARRICVRGRAISRRVPRRHPAAEDPRRLARARGADAGGARRRHLARDRAPAIARQLQAVPDSAARRTCFGWLPAGRPPRRALGSGNRVSGRRPRRARRRSAAPSMLASALVKVARLARPGALAPSPAWSRSTSRRCSRRACGASWTATSRRRDGRRCCGVPSPWRPSSCPPAPGCSTSRTRCTRPPKPWWRTCPERHRPDALIAMSDSIGHYRIVRQIGRGGMGIVYEAFDEVLQRSVALKTILPSADPQMRDRLMREARAAAAVSHRNICQIFEIGEHSGEPYLAMELLDGQALADRLADGPMPPAEAVSTAIAVLSALDALHTPLDRASRSEAVERLPLRARRQAARLRAGASVRAHGRRHRADAAGRPARHAALHGAGAGARGRGGCAHRSLRRRLAAVRDAERPAGVQRRRADRGAARRAARSAAGARRLAGGRGRRPRHPARADEVAEGALPVGRGDGPRSAPLPGEGRSRRAAWSRARRRD